MLTTEALQYCNNRIQELASSYDNETIQKLRDIVECLFSYLDEHDIDKVDLDIWKLLYIVIDIQGKYNALDINTNFSYSKSNYNDAIIEEGSFDLHNINNLLDWVFKDEN